MKILWRKITKWHLQSAWKLSWRRRIMFGDAWCSLLVNWKKGRALPGPQWPFLMGPLSRLGLTSIHHRPRSLIGGRRSCFSSCGRLYRVDVGLWHSRLGHSSPRLHPPTCLVHRQPLTSGWGRFAEPGPGSISIVPNRVWEKNVILYKIGSRSVRLLHF